MAYWIHENGKTIGPFRVVEVLDRAGPDTLVSHGQQWFKLSEHPDLGANPRAYGPSADVASPEQSQDARRNFWLYIDGETYGPMAAKTVIEHYRAGALVSHGETWVEIADHPGFSHLCTNADEMRSKSDPTFCSSAKAARQGGPSRFQTWASGPENIEQAILKRLPFNRGILIAGLAALLTGVAVLGLAVVSVGVFAAADVADVADFSGVGRQPYERQELTTFGEPNRKIMSCSDLQKFLKGKTQSEVRAFLGSPFGTGTLGGLEYDATWIYPGVTRGSYREGELDHWTIVSFRAKRGRLVVDGVSWARRGEIGPDIEQRRLMYGR
jgi:hypothetical protein